MKLRQVGIQSLPGITRPFELEGLRDGLNIVSGPNGVGKSRLCAAVRLLLWPGTDESSRSIVARAAFEEGDHRWRVQSDPSGHAWQRDGVESDAPSLPSPHLDACFFLGLRDLLDDQDRAGRDLAAEVRRQMSGGFDLGEVARGFSDAVGARIGQNERKAVFAAASEVQKARREQAGVEAREQELVTLRGRAAEAERAAPRAAYFETAIQLQTMKGEAERIERERAEFPAEMDQLDGREIDRLDRLEERIETKGREREAAERALRDAEEAARMARLDAPIEAARLGAFRDRVDEVGDLERERSQASVAESAAREGLVECRRVLGDHASKLDAASLNQTLTIEEDLDLFAMLRESQSARGDLEEVRARLEYLAERTFSDEEARRLELLRRGVEPLRAWLRAPQPVGEPEGEADASAGRVSAKIRRVGVGAVLVLGGLAASVLGDGLAGDLPIGPRSLGLLAIGFGASLIVLGLWPVASRTGGRGDDWRRVAEAQFPAELGTPESWSTEAVGRLLRALEDELARLDSSEKRARDRGVERGPLEKQLRKAEVRAAELDERWQALAQRLGLESLAGDAEIVDLARGLEAARRAANEVRMAIARSAELDERWRALLDEVSAFLLSLGEASPHDAAAARAAVHDVAARSRTLEEAGVESRRQVERCEQIDAELEGLLSERSEIFEQAGVARDDRAGLARRVDALQRYRELSDAWSGRKAQIEHALSELERGGEADLAERGVVELEAERAAALRIAEERTELENQIGAIVRDAERMRSGHAVEDALARQEEAIGALAARRDEALFARAGAFLVERVRNEYEDDQMPRVLMRARDHFSDFTHHRYTLEVSADESGSFVALSNETGDRLRPDELSDGTRAQLVLAARLAFAEEAEKGAKLPLFLDEAMDHSDPERFHAIAKGLARMVREQDRQIFYLTNDPSDVEKFERAFAEEGCASPIVHDLEKIRGLVARIDRPEALRVVPLDSVPCPEPGETVDAYGVRLGVPRFDPAEGAAAQHLIHLLRDDPMLLHGLLEARFATVGQCRGLLEPGARLPPAIRDVRGTGESLAGRIALLDTFCRVWSEGRGRPIGRGELEASRAVTAKFIDAVSAVARDLDGDARRLIDTLASRSDPRVHGYRSSSAEKLERFLIERGYLDERPVLGMDEIVQRAIATPVAQQLGTKETTELIHTWWTLSHHSKSPA